MASEAQLNKLLVEEHTLSPKEKRAAYDKKYHETNREKKLAYQKKYREDNREKLIAYKVANREKISEQQRKRKYGLSQQDWDVMFEAQGRKCKGCETDTPGSKYGWHTDHCHTTNKVRGILCHHCNLALGNVKDSISTLRRLASYLEE